MLFFFYGTLLAGGQNPVAARLHRKLQPGIPATATGRLWALPDPAGWYPAFCPTAQGAPVHGLLFATAPAFAAADLAALDRYEDYCPDAPQASEYLRRMIAVQTAEGSARAAAYCYNQPWPPGAEPIPDGDFRAWLKQRGVSEFRP